MVRKDLAKAEAYVDGVLAGTGIVPPVKRGRGRPRKNDPAVIHMPAAKARKRGPGRPRKVNPAEDSIPTREVTQSA